MSDINHFQAFLDKLYSLFSQSPKNQIIKKEISKGLLEEVLNIGKLLNTRWVASTFRIVSVVGTITSSSANILIMVEVIKLVLRVNNQVSGCI